MKKLVCVAVILCLSMHAYAAGRNIPVEARKHMARGRAAVEHAQNESDYKDAVREFTQAAKLAPEWTDAYYNLGLAQEKAGQYDSAIRSLKTYLEKSPNATDAEEVQDKIFQIEYLEEKAAKKPIQQAPAQAFNIESLAGTWVTRKHGGEGTNPITKLWEPFDNEYHYKLSVTGPNSFRLQYSHAMWYYPNTGYRMTPEGVSFNMLQQTYDVTVNGQEIKGDLTCQTSGPWGSVPRRTFAITGRMASDGSKFTLIENHIMPDFMGGGAWTKPAVKLVWDFVRP